MRRASEFLPHVLQLCRAGEPQEVGFSSRPFVLCGLPISRPDKTSLLHVRQNGLITLRVTGDPEVGLPWGQDRLIPIWLATEAIRRQSREISFASAADVLRAFDLVQGGGQYRRIVEGFKRVLGATIEFRTEAMTRSVVALKMRKLTFASEALLWYDPQWEQTRLPGMENVIVLSQEFWEELKDHPIPLDLGIVRELSQNAGALDLYAWLTWRCWKVRRQDTVPLFGPLGLIHQLGVGEYHRARKFRERMLGWLARVVEAWPECPARLTPDHNALVLRPGTSVLPKKSTTTL